MTHHHQDTNRHDRIAMPQEERTLSGQALDQLVANVRGQIILPHAPTYQAARRVWNALVDRHPAIIVRCADVWDVCAAVHFAHEQHMPLSVRSGGHSMSGHSTNDDGVVIDLSPMKGITVDPVRRTARLEPGLTWKDVAQTLQPFGLAMTSGDVGSVGVGGSLLGGGIGWMARSQGLTIDHLRAVELVTADGQLLRASADEHPELFWGLRGGGGNFGVATAFELNLHQGGTIFGGAIFYEAADAARMLKEYARIAAAAPEELTTEVSLMLAPPVPFIPIEKQGTPVIAITACYIGDLSEGERAVAPLRQLATPLADVIGPMPYAEIFGLTEVGEVRDFQHHVRSQFFTTLSDAMLETLADVTQTIMSPETLVNLRVLGGAMGRVANDATAFAHRDKQGMVFVTHYGPPSLEPASLDARSQHIFAALQPYASGVYMGFLEDEGEQRLHEAYPSPTYERLVALKNQYDPTNLFRLNQNIKPNSAERSGTLTFYSPSETGRYE